MYYPPNIFINRGMKTLDGKITKVAILTPKLVPTTTKRILKMLLPHKSLKLSIFAKFFTSLCLTCLNLASANPENHPAASNGWIMVNGATKPPITAERGFDPESIDPINPIIILMAINSYMFQVIFIPFI